MGTFITDGASVLPDVKTDARPSTGATTEWAAADANEVRSALLDLRTAALAVQTGFVNPNTALVTSNGTPGLTHALQDWMAIVEATGGNSGTVTGVFATAPVNISGTPTVTPTINISEASESARGTMSAAHYTKLENLTNATGSVAGLMSATDKTKLDAFPSVTGSTSNYLRADGTWQAVGGGGGGTGTVTSVGVSGGTTGLTTSGGPVTNSGTITLGGTLAVANGGTGATSLTSASVLVGNGTSAVSGVAPGTSGNVLVSSGSAWTSGANAPAWSAVTGKPTVVSSVGGDGVITTSGATSITVSLGTVPVANGGTGLTSLGSANQVLAVNSGATALAYVSASDSGGTSNFAKRDSSGNLYANDFYATSDSRLKTDIEQIVGALATVKSLRGVKFKKISDPAHYRVGLIAQETAQVVPEAIYESAGPEHYLSVNYGSLVGVLVEAVKELSEKVAALEALNGAP